MLRLQRGGLKQFALVSLKHILISLSLSLSHTHTHTRTHTQSTFYSCSSLCLAINHTDVYCLHGAVSKARVFRCARHSEMLKQILKHIQDGSLSVPKTNTHTHTHTHTHTLSLFFHSVTFLFSPFTELWHKRMTVQLTFSSYCQTLSV